MIYNQLVTWTITSARSTVIAAEVAVKVMLTSAPLCISYYKQNKLYRLVYDDSRQLECPNPLAGFQSQMGTLPSWVSLQGGPKRLTSTFFSDGPKKFQKVQKTNDF